MVVTAPAGCVLVPGTVEYVAVFGKANDLDVLLVCTRVALLKCPLVGISLAGWVLLATTRRSFVAPKTAIFAETGRPDVVVKLAERGWVHQASVQRHQFVLDCIKVVGVQSVVNVSARKSDAITSGNLVSAHGVGFGWCRTEERGLEKTGRTSVVNEVGNSQHVALGCALQVA